MQQERARGPCPHHPAHPAGPGGIWGSSPGGRRPKGHGREGAGKGSLPHCCSHPAPPCPCRASLSPHLGTFLAPSPDPPPPSPAPDRGQVALRGRRHRQRISFPIRALPGRRRGGGSSHPAGQGHWKAPVTPPQASVFHCTFPRRFDSQCSNVWVSNI